jgi:hypothetical protein
MPGTQDAGGNVVDGGSVEAASLPSNTLDLLRAISPRCYDDDGGDSEGGRVNPRGCAFNNGCLDPMQQGSTCELFTTGCTAADLEAGNDTCFTVANALPVTHFSSGLPDGKNCSTVLGTEPVSETTVCLQTLSQMFSTNCATALDTTPCLCGATASAACLGGLAMPNGALFDEYACDFNSTNGSSINNSFQVQTFGAGMANALYQCMASFAKDNAPDPDCCACLVGGYVDAGNCIAP